MIQLPLFFTGIAKGVANKMPEPLSFAKVPLTTSEHVYNSLKFLGVYLTPIIGAPMELYHRFIDAVFITLDQAENTLLVPKNAKNANGYVRNTARQQMRGDSKTRRNDSKTQSKTGNTPQNKLKGSNKASSKKKDDGFVMINCKDHGKLMADIMERALRGKKYKMLIDKYEVRDLFEYLVPLLRAKGGNTSAMNDLKNANTVTKMGSSLVLYLFCNSLELFSLMSRALDGVGSTAEIVDMIKSAGASRVISILILFITLIIYWIFY